MALKPLRLFRGDTLSGIIESFVGFGEFGGGGGNTVYTGAGVSVPNAASRRLPWTNLSQGVDLLDRTDPTKPKVLEDGTYSLSAFIGGVNLTPGGYAALAMVLSSVGVIGFDKATPPGSAQMDACAVFDAAAGDEITLEVDNEDGASARNFLIDTALLLKL